MHEIIAERRSYTPRQLTHQHEYGQLIFPLVGKMAIETNSQAFLLDENQLLFMPPHLDHTYFSLGRNEFLVLDIPLFFLKKDDLVESAKGCTYDLNEKWKGIRFLLLNELRELEGSSTATTGLRELMPYVARQLVNRKWPESIQFIQEHFAENITIAQLAEIEHYHPGYYSKWFHRFTGKTPLEYIQAVRIEKAQELLVHTTLPIAHITFQVGFEHQASLTRLFQQLVGISPSQYRKTYGFGVCQDQRRN